MLEILLGLLAAAGWGLAIVALGVATTMKSRADALEENLEERTKRLEACRTALRSGDG